MKTVTAVCLALLLVACRGGEKAETRTDSGPEAPASVEKVPAPATTPTAMSDPCAPLEARMVRYDTSGKPFFFSFEIPRGFEVKEYYSGGTAGADVTLDLDGNGGDEYILRLVQNSRTNENTAGLVDLWRKMSSTQKVLEQPVGGRTMFIQRSAVGEMVGFQAMFPDFDSPGGSHLVIGGVTNAPKECREQAAETVEQMLLSFERNPRIGPPPAGK